MKAAIYLRISDDRAGDAGGVTRQRQDCLAYAERHGLEIVEVYEDNDISASAYARKNRPAYRKMIGAAKAGELDVIVAWHLDRLYRQPRELEDLVDLVEARGGGLAIHTLSGPFDLTTADGRAMARVVTAMAAKSSDDSSRRIRRKAQELAENGKPHGGGTRAYGYEPRGLEIREEEAARIREAARRLLAGDAVRSILRDWTTAGVPTVSGAPWRVTSFRKMMMSPRIAGLREHNGAVVGPASWPAIITPDQHEELRAILLDPSRRTQNGTKRRYLLTGLAVCGLCGTKLIARPRAGSIRAMVCPRPDGCGKIRRVAEPLEDHVRDRVLDALDPEALQRALHARAGAGPRARTLIERIRADEARLDRVKRLMVDGELTAADGRRFRVEIEEALARDRRSLATMAGSAVLGELANGDVRAWWDAATVDRRRAVLALLVDRVVIHTAIRGLNRFDPSRVEIIWRQ
jgi:DNA invertase Pin-like site-specific DNA recombinase